MVDRNSVIVLSSEATNNNDDETVLKKDAPKQKDSAAAHKEKVHKKDVHKMLLGRQNTKKECQCQWSWEETSQERCYKGQSSEEHWYQEDSKRIVLTKGSQGKIQ